MKLGRQTRVLVVVVFVAHCCCLPLQDGVKWGIETGTGTEAEAEAECSQARACSLWQAASWQNEGTTLCISVTPKTVKD